MKTTKEIGDTIEDIVAYALEERGFSIVERNIYTRYGELDIVASKREVLHIVEVKFQSSNHFGGVEFALSRRKFSRIQKSVYELLAKGELPDGQIQYDYAAVRYINDRYEVTMYENISLADINQ